jgi:hypothetical protein
MLNIPLAGGFGLFLLWRYNLGKSEKRRLDAEHRLREREEAESSILDDATLDEQWLMETIALESAAIRVSLLRSQS